MRLNKNVLKNKKKFFENQLKPVMLVLEGQLSLSYIRWGQCPQPLGHQDRP